MTCRDWTRLRRESGEQISESWCENNQSDECKYPAPILEGLTKRAFTFFGKCKTQLNVGGMGGVIGFDYAGCQIPARAYGFDLEDPAFFEAFQLFEDAWVEAVNESGTKKKDPKLPTSVDLT